jgi:hypothetical protein
MVKQISSVSHTVNIAAELDKLSKQRSGTKICRKRMRHFCDPTVSRVTVLVDTLAVHYKKTVAKSPAASDVQSKYQRASMIEKNLKQFISRLDSFQLPEEKIVTSPVPTKSASLGPSHFHLSKAATESSQSVIAPLLPTQKRKLRTQ